MAKAPLAYSTWSGAGLTDPTQSNVTTTPDMGGWGSMPDIDSYFADLLPEETAPQQEVGAAVYYSPSQKKFVVGGQEIDEVNETALAQAAQTMRPTPTPPPGGDYVPVDDASWSQFVQQIIDPGMGRLASRNFGRGVDQLQQLAGAGLSFLGAEETGAGIIEQQSKDLANTEIYNRNFTDIGSSPERGAIDWFVANVAQQGPNILESILSATAGAVIGSAAGGPGLGTIGGAIAGITGKQAFREAVKTAAEKYAAGVALDAVEAAALRKATAIAGAAIASGASNYGMGVSDIYLEGLETGTDSRGAAALGAIPYAALETLPEFFLAGRVFSEAAGNKAVANSFKARAWDRAKRVTGGATRQAGMEGSTELGQEALLIAATTNDWDNPETVNRFINSFAAGAAVGAAGGAFGGMLHGRSQATNLLNPSEDPSTGGVTPVPQLPGPAPIAGLLPAPTRLLTDQTPRQLGFNIRAEGPNALDQQEAQAANAPRTIEGTATEVLPPAAGAASPETQARFAEMQQQFRRNQPWVPTLPATNFAETPANPTDILGGQQQTAASRLRRGVANTAAENRARQQYGGNRLRDIVSRQNQQGAVPTSPAPAGPQQAVVSAQTPPTDAAPPAGGTNPLMQLLDQGQEVTTNAAQEGTQQQNRILEREQTPQGGVPTEAGRGNRLVKGRQKQQIKAPTQVGKTEFSVGQVAGKRWVIYEGGKLAENLNGVNGFDNKTKASEAARKESKRRQAEAKKKTPAKKPQAAPAAPAQETTPTPTSAAPQEQPAAEKKTSVRKGGRADIDYLWDRKKPYDENDEELANTVLNVVDRAYFPTSEQVKSGMSAEAREVLQAVSDTGKYSKEQLHNDIVNAITEMDKLNVWNAAGVRPWVDYALNNNLLTDGTINLDSIEIADNADMQDNRVQRVVAILDEHKNRAKHEDKVLKNADKQANKTETLPGSFDDDVADGNYLRATDGRPITKPMGKGEMRMHINRVLSKFKVKPKVTIVKNVADLKSSMPALYKAAKAARSSSDLDTTPAYGFTFGDNVILFSDKIATKKQLTFTLLHETLGHVGLRGLVGPKNVASEMMKLYNSDPRIASAVESYKLHTGVNNTVEAVEEWLADNVARLDSSLVVRAWRGIQRMLSKVGIKLGDEAAIPLMYNIRRFVRGEGSHFSADVLKTNMEAVKRQQHELRFERSVLDEGRVATNLTGAFAHQLHESLPTSITEAYTMLRERGKNFSELMRGVAAFLETLDFKSARNQGLRNVYEVFEQSANHTKEVLRNVGEKTKLTHSIRYGGLVKNAPTEQDRNSASEAMAYITLYFDHKFDEAALDRFGPLFNVNLGDIDPKVRKQLVDSVKINKEELARGLKAVDKNGNEVTFPAVQLSDKAWTIVEEQTEALRYVAEENLKSIFNRKSIGLETIRELLLADEGSSGFGVSPQVADDILAITRKYTDMWEKAAKVTDGEVEVDSEQRDRANTFMMEMLRAFHTKAKLNDWLNGKKDEDSEQFRNDPEFKPYIDTLPRIYKALGEGTQRQLEQRLQPLINSLTLAGTEAMNADLKAKKTFLIRYAPLFRDGPYEVRQVMVDAKTGKQISTDTLPLELRRAMYYSREKKLSDRDATAAALKDIWGDGTYKLRVPDLDTKATEDNPSPMKTIEVKFDFVAGSARQLPESGMNLSFYEMITALDRWGINLTPAERKRLVQKTTEQGSRARANLMREGNPGFDKDVLKGIERHIEQQAHVISKNMYGLLLDHAMTNKAAYHGNTGLLRKLESDLKNARNPDERKLAERALGRYAMQYAWSHAPTTSRKTIEVNGRTLELKGRGNEAWDDARRLLAFYDTTDSIINTAGRVFKTEIGAKLTTATVAAHLGGFTLATPIVNVTSLPIMTANYLASYNPNKGYGLGHGHAKAYAAITKAITDVAAPKWEQIDFFDDLLKKVSPGTNPQDAIKGTNLKRHEVQLLMKAAEFGWTSPAATDALVQSVRGSMSPTLNDAIRRWMFLFNYSEQVNRRTTILATYRLEYERARKAGKSHSDAAEMATREAKIALDASQGDYNLYNRPRLFQGDIMSYVFMYKMITLVMTNILIRMGWKGKVGMLALLLLASGLKGLPFAEDFADLVDTLAQIFGIPLSGIEREAASLVNAIIPGAAPWVMRGGLDTLTGATFSTRVGMGNLIPLTGALKYGADPWREASDFAGPVFSVAGDLFAWTGMAGRYGMEAVGMAPDTIKFEDLVRNFPSASIRAMGDTYAYLDDGAVTNSRGQVVVKDVGASMIAMRLLGFYPAAATKQYDAIRAEKFFDAYKDALKLKFVQAYVKADTPAERRAIVQDVAEWNRSARGTDFVINNFIKSAQRARQSAMQTASQRFAKTLPKDQREAAREAMQVLGIAD